MLWSIRVWCGAGIRRFGRYQRVLQTHRVVRACTDSTYIPQTRHAERTFNVRGEPKMRPTGFLQCFDTVGLVIWPLKVVPEMTYDVLSGTLSLYTTATITNLRWGPKGWSNNYHLKNISYKVSAPMQTKIYRGCEAVVAGRPSSYAYNVSRIMFIDRRTSQPVNKVTQNIVCESATMTKRVFLAASVIWPMSGHNSCPQPKSPPINRLINDRLSVNQTLPELINMSQRMLTDPLLRQPRFCN